MKNIIEEKVVAVLCDNKNSKLVANKLYNSYVFAKNSISLFDLAEQTSKAYILEVTKKLSKAKIVTLNVNKKYAAMSFNLDILEPNDRFILEQNRLYSLVDKYSLKLDKRNYSNSLAKVNGNVVDNYINREGFNRQAKTEFQFDIEMLEKYREPIEEEVLKSINKLVSKGMLSYTFFDDEANYKYVVIRVIDRYIDNPKQWYNNEYNVLDSRGRAIYQSMNKILNPITYTIGRALLKFKPRTITTKDHDALQSIYYFISTELGYKDEDFDTLIDKAIDAYNNKEVPNKLHTKIIIERIYKTLDKLYALGSVEWDIPIEIDARASVMQFYGLLTGDKRILDRVSITSSKIIDPWNVDGVRRDVIKAYFTPTLYGSAASIENLCAARNLVPTKKEKQLCKLEMKKGAFGVANQLKKILIKTSNINTPTFKVNIFGEKINVSVNKFKVAGTKLRAIKVFNGKKEVIVHNNEVKVVPDYDRFKYYLATLLVHNLDSQVMNRICNSATTDTGIIPIHDAVITHPLDALNIRNLYTHQIEKVYEYRKEILNKYLESINAIGMKTKIAMKKLKEMVEEAEKPTFYNHCMK